MSRIVERLVKFEEWENKFGEHLSKQLNWGKEVVRCKDCEHYNAMTHGCKRNPCVEPWEENDFCSYGERKEREDE